MLAMEMCRWARMRTVNLSLGVPEDTEEIQSRWELSNRWQSTLLVYIEIEMMST